MLSNMVLSGKWLRKMRGRGFVMSARALGSVLATIILGLMMTGAACAASAVNLQHLDFLKAEVETPSGSLPIWWVYAEPRLDGKYHYVMAAGEGVACVDDVARAAIVYMKHFQAESDLWSLTQAKDALEFVLAMQRDDGLFYNFIHANGEINKTGVTSRPGVNWWTARAMWALAEGIATFEEIDPEFSEALHAAFIKAFSHLEREAGSLYGLDLAGVFLMATAVYAETLGVTQGGIGVEPEPGSGDANLPEVTSTLLSRITSVADRLGSLLVAYQIDDPNDSNAGMRPSDRSAPYSWHAWGNHGLEALAYAGVVFGRPEWIESAQFEADVFLSSLMADFGTISLIEAKDGSFGVIRLYPQIAYGQATMVRGMIELYRAVGDEKYAELALQAAGWFFGDNPAQTAMYHMRSGRGFDGIDGGDFEEPRVNWSSGAESTIETLWALVELESAGLFPLDLLFPNPIGRTTIQ